MELPNYSPDVDPEVARRSSRSNAERAVALDPNFADGQAVLGWDKLVHGFDWSGAESALYGALELQPNNVNALHWLSHVRSWRGDHGEAIELAALAVELDPLSPLIARNLGYIHMDSGDFPFANRTVSRVAGRGSHLVVVGKLVGSAAAWATFRGRCTDDRADRANAGTGRDASGARCERA